MIVPKAYQENWERNYDPGDKKKISEYIPCAPGTVKDAFKGDAPEWVIAGINNFYTEKKERLAKSFTK